MRQSYACLLCFVIGATSQAKLLRETKALANAAASPRPWVRCELTAGPINIEVHPEWAPIGAKRFLELVDLKFFDGQAMFRAIPDFIVQFGISGDAAVRQEWNKKPSLTDDPLRPDVPVKLGTLAYAGSGANSRATQIWISFSDENHGLGKQPWETPFAQIVGTKSLDTVRHINTQYEDEPDQRRIEFQGYSYLRSAFPKLDYIKSCRVISSIDLAKAQKEDLAFDSQVKLHEASQTNAEVQEDESDDASSSASDASEDVGAEAEQSVADADAEQSSDDDSNSAGDGNDISPDEEASEAFSEEESE